MKILLASSEVHPYSKTGGLADMVGALAKALARQGHRVGVVAPLYAGIREQFRDIKTFDYLLEVPLGNARVRGAVCVREPNPALAFYFIDHPGFFQRDGLYQNNGTDYPDNAERFVFFSKAVAQLGMYLPWKPELLHLNDWQTGLVPLFLRQHSRGAGPYPAPQNLFYHPQPRLSGTLHHG